jgi:hypothetical protein
VDGHGTVWVSIVEEIKIVVTSLYNTVVMEVYKLVVVNNVIINQVVTIAFVSGIQVVVLV